MKKLIIIVAMLLVLNACGNGEKVNFNNTKTITFYDLTVELPTVFENDDVNSDNTIQFYSYSDDDNYNSCMLYLAISDYPKSDMKEAIQDMFYDVNDWLYNEKNINGNKWYIGYKENNAKSNQSYYVINKNGKEYSLNYNDLGSGDDCAEALKVIENSLNFK